MKEYINNANKKSYKNDTNMTKAYNDSATMKVYKSDAKMKAYKQEAAANAYKTEAMKKELKNDAKKKEFKNDAAMYGNPTDQHQPEMPNDYRCIDRFMTTAFYKLGKVVSLHRTFFLLMPLLVAIVCVHGITRFTIQDDVVYLFTPQGSPGMADGKVMKTHFQSGDNETEFLPDRELIDRQTRGSIIVREKNGGSVLTTAAFDEITRLDDLVRTFTFSHNHTDGLSYAHVCQTWLNACHDNLLMQILRPRVAYIDHMNLTFPFIALPSSLPPPQSASQQQSMTPEQQQQMQMQLQQRQQQQQQMLQHQQELQRQQQQEQMAASQNNAAGAGNGAPGAQNAAPNDAAGAENAASDNAPQAAARMASPSDAQNAAAAAAHRVFIGNQIGGVELYPGSDVMESAKALLLIYSVTRETYEAEEVAYVWEEHFVEEVEKFSATAEHIVISYETSFGLADEVGESSKRVIPLFVATFVMLVIFAVGSCIMRDWVQSKPWLGLIGVVSASLAIVSSLGFLSYCGLEFNEIVSLMPFLIIGVGVDNMFIMIAGWRQLSIYLPVHERMGRTYSEAAVSITITNLTTILAFIIGATISLPAIRSFCIYAGVAMFFAYFYQITFFGACMAFTGEREARNVHCYTCKKVLSKDESPNKLYSIFCAGGVPQPDSKCKKPASHIIHPIMVMFRDYYGPFIMRSWVKVIVVGLFVTYLGGAIYGCMNITEGLKLRNLARDGSPAWRFYKELEDYFSEYGPIVSVAVTEEVDYWNATTQDSLDQTLMDMESTELFHGAEVSKSWLRVYAQYLRAIFGTSEVDRETFIYILQNRFLTDYRFKEFELDITFEYGADNATAIGIKASRFLVSSQDMYSAMRKRDMMMKARATALDSPYDMVTFHPMFVVYDQYVGTVPALMQTLGIAMACMMIVSLVMIPHPICAFFVTLCAISIDAAVIGYMSLWGVSLDTVSMVNIILCIGFSVDFSAHITYAFVSSPNEDPNQRAVTALYAVGMPIIQGALSSMIALSPLATAPTYLFRTFFKTLFLAMSFGAMHGLVFLPVLLSFLGKFIPRNHLRDEDGHEHEVEVDEEKKMKEDCHIFVNYALEPPVIAPDREGEYFLVEAKVSVV